MCNALSTSNPPLTLEAGPPHRTKYAGLWLLQQIGFIRATYSKHASTQHDWCWTSTQPVSGIRPQEGGQACCSCDLYIEKGGDDRLIGKGVPDTNLFITITHSPPHPYRPAPPRLFGSSVKYVDAFRIAFTEKPK